MIRVHLYGTFYGTPGRAAAHGAGRAGAPSSTSRSILGLQARPAGARTTRRPRRRSSPSPSRWPQEVAQLGIRVNAVCPGYVDTPLLAPLTTDEGDGRRCGSPAGAWPSADELAELVRFLVGDEAVYCTGDVWQRLRAGTADAHDVHPDHRRGDPRDVRLARRPVRGVHVDQPAGARPRAGRADRGARPLDRRAARAERPPVRGRPDHRPGAAARRSAASASG